MIKKQVFTGLIILLFFSFAKAQSPSLPQLIDYLKSGDGVKQMTARQLLPRFGVSAIEQLLPLLQESNPTGKAAKDTLFDAAAELCAPGREIERSQAVELLARLTEPQQPQPIKIVGLEILALAIPLDGDVQSIARLLSDPDLFDKARTALERIGGVKARESLRNAVHSAAPEQQCALLDSLGELKDRDSLDLLKTILKGDNAGLRLAALRAIARIGDPQSSEYFWPSIDRVICDPATPPQIFINAMDSAIRFANAWETTPEHQSDAVTVYRKTLPMKSGAHLSAALAGLGRCATEACFPDVMKMLHHADLRARQSAENALKKLGGEETTIRLAAEYPAQDQETQLRLIPILGARKSASASPILLQAAQSENANFRLAALAALGAAEQADACGVLLKASRQDSPEGAIARNSLLQIAEVLAKKGQNMEAGQAFAVALSASPDREQRIHALEGLASCPNTEAYDDVVKAAAQPEYKMAVIPALAAMSSLFTGANDVEKSFSLLKQLQALQPSYEILTQAIQQLKRINPTLDTASLLGFVKRWQIVGPFPKEGQQTWGSDFIQEPNIDLQAIYPVGDQKKEWKSVQSTDDNGKIDLLKLLGDCSQSFGYAYSEITVDAETDAILKLGVDDGERIWINGDAVFNNFVARPFKIDEDTVPVHLKVGVNRILMKIYQNAMGWEFCLRIIKPDGGVLPFMPMKAD